MMVILSILGKYSNLSKKHNHIVCGDEISHKIKLDHMDEINLEGSSTINKSTARDGSCIGIAYTTSITESSTQGSLGFKH